MAIFDFVKDISRTMNDMALHSTSEHRAARRDGTTLTDTNLNHYKALVRWEQNGCMGPKPVNR